MQPQDTHTQDALLALACLDAPFMEDNSTQVKATIFQAVDNHPDSMNRQMIADVAIPYFQTHNEPVGVLLIKELKREYKSIVSAKRWESLVAYATNNILNRKLTADGTVRGVPRTGIAQWLSSHTEERNAMRFAKWFTNTAAQGTISAQTIREQVERLLPIPGAEAFIYSTPLAKDTDSFRASFQSMLMDARVFPDIGIPGLTLNIAAMKDIALLLAPYKRGKSIFLMHLAHVYTAQGFNVVHLDLENTKALMTARYIASSLNLPLNDLKDYEVEKMVRRFKRRAWRWESGNLKTVNWADRVTTVSMVENLIKRLCKSPERPHIVIIDYDDLIKLDNQKSNQDPRLASIEVYNRMKELCERYGVMMWLACQAQRSAALQSRVEANSAAENIDKIRRCAVVVTLGVGPQDRTIQLTVAESRNDVSGVSIVVPTAYDCMRFVDYDQAAKNLKSAQQTPRGKK